MDKGELSTAAKEIKGFLFFSVALGKLLVGDPCSAPTSYLYNNVKFLKHYRYAYDSLIMSNISYNGSNTKPKIRGSHTLRKMNAQRKRLLQLFSQHLFTIIYSVRCFKLLKFGIPPGQYGYTGCVCGRYNTSLGLYGIYCQGEAETNIAHTALD